MINRKGVTRIVLLIGRYAFKIPNFTHSHKHFLKGMYGNWSERKFTKHFKKHPELYDLIAPTLFCTFFGLLSIQKRGTPLSEDEYDTFLNNTSKEVFKRYYDICNGDNKNENFAKLNNKIVCVDYV